MLKYALCTLALIVVSAVHAEEKVKATDPVSGKAADTKNVVEYNGGKVYFESKENADTFKKDTKKYAAKANFQLFQTGQFTQEKCPLTGKDTSDKTVTIEGTKVALCCAMCQGKMEKLKGDELVSALFADAAFKKGFVKK